MKFYTENPYDYNTIALRKMKTNRMKYTPTANELLLNPNANYIGKYLGVDNKLEWSHFYDKVNDVYQWAKQVTGSDDLPTLIKAISEKLNTTPSLNNRRINDLHLAISLNPEVEPAQTNKPEVENTEDDSIKDSGEGVQD